MGDHILDYGFGDSPAHKPSRPKPNRDPTASRAVQANQSKETRASDHLQHLNCLFFVVDTNISAIIDPYESPDVRRKCASVCPLNMIVHRLSGTKEFCVQTLGFHGRFIDKIGYAPLNKY